MSKTLLARKVKASTHRLKHQTDEAAPKGRTKCRQRLGPEGSEQSKGIIRPLNGELTVCRPQVLAPDLRIVPRRFQTQQYLNITTYVIMCGNDLNMNCAVVATATIVLTSANLP